ncbi:hypothetical protein RKE29_10045 [Streptomyces sp. B1866]|uniref:hypothetical protein n=1 Tax=Streptomyces sp. B1866 TaxID=3075431 RepID=UPI002892629D|nr:hypothetical protein [Streptomyces sp. B1866]MDT3396984.1 hypothetical protein [Streptomyces sp. B1866]
MPTAATGTRRVVQTAALLALLVFFAAQLVGAVLPNVPLLVAAAAGGLALDLLLQHRHPGLLSLLGRIRFDVTMRQLLRDMLTMVGLLRTEGIDPLHEQAPLTGGLLAFYVVHFVCQAVAVLVRRARQLPIVTRNIDASPLRPTAAPPRVFARQHGRRLLRLAVPVSAGLLATAATANGWWGAAGLSAGLLVALGGTAHLATWLLPGKRPVDEAWALAWLDRWLAEYRPTLGLYFSGGATSAYQANMWLSTLAALDGRPVIVLRERFMVQKIEATDVPIVCVPRVADLMRLEHSTLKAILHPANSGKTSQVLRIPSIKHAFINHGESDKLSSCNPYAKAYDEVWVAGPAARERYQLADIGVEDKDVVEVGRPQLAPILPSAGPPAGPYTTVLYAPTWEGWDGNPGNTSVVLAGENIVRALLADPGVRLLYKPHPMTGSVDPRAGAADTRVRAMIAAANARRSGPRPDPGAAAELARRTEELERLTARDFRPSADELERMMLQGAPAPGRAEAVAEATAAWEAAYWASLPEWEHQVIADARPALYSCFNRAHLLISDVSSVVSDYLTSEKPYAVANTSGLPEEEFRAGLPTVSAATILTPDADGVPALLAAVRDPSLDTAAAARAALKTRLLGPADPPSLVRFDAAAQALCARSDERRARMAARADGDIPSQREARGDADGIEPADGPEPAGPGEAVPAPAGAPDPAARAGAGTAEP